MHTRPCHRERLAAGDFAQVELCDCGAAHLTIGAVTLRVAPAAIAELAEVVVEAARQLALHDVVAERRARWSGAVS